MALYEHLMPESLKAPEKRTGDALVDYLIAHPDAAGNFRFRELDSGQMTRLLCVCPQFVTRCGTGKIALPDANKVIIAQPELLDRFKPTKLDWVRILCRRPELVKKLPCYLNKSDWFTILSHQPGLWDDSPFHDFDTSEWSQLIRDQPVLAEKCPWDRLNFIRAWRDSILLHPDVVLAHREDWAHFHHLGGYGPEALAPLIARKPELGEEVDLRTFRAEEWKIILKSQPQLIERCSVKKVFPDVPLDLLDVRPELAEHFNWTSCSSLSGLLKLRAWPELFMKFTREQPNLACRILKICREADWEYLLPKYPEFLLEHSGYGFSFCHNLKALLLAGVFPDIDRVGLDTICNNIFDGLMKIVPSPAGWFAKEDLTPAEFLIKSVMDPTNAGYFFFRKIRLSQWSLCSGLLDCDREALYRFLPPEKCAFLLCSAAPQSLCKKYLDLNREALSFRDRKGNTLLHAALLRAALERIDAPLRPGNPARKLYDFLVARGCDPDRKNRCGVSCGALLTQISEKVDLWTEKLCR